MANRFRNMMEQPPGTDLERLVLWNKYNRVCRFVERVASCSCRKAAYKEAREVLKEVGEPQIFRRRGPYRTRS